MIEKSQIAIIIVLYQPSSADLSSISLLGEMYQMVVVDNSSEESAFLKSNGAIQYIFNGGNLGIAEAQNIGLRIATKQKGITHIVFLDQDSRTTNDYPLAIAREFERHANGRKLAFLGPSVRNVETGDLYRSIVHHDQQTDEDFIARRDVISSGGCTTLECLKDIGLNDCRLFIDYVDFEWCWRAQSKGYVCGITPRLTITHHVGQNTISLWGYLIIISSPKRYFYQFRNYLWLVRRKYVPLQWKIATGIKYAARMVYFPLCIRTGTQCWKYMMKGIYAGMRK